MYQLFILVLQPLRRELMKDHKTQITRSAARSYDC